MSTYEVVQVILASLMICATLAAPIVGTYLNFRLLQSADMEKDSITGTNRRNRKYSRLLSYIIVYTFVTVGLYVGLTSLVAEIYSTAPISRETLTSFANSLFMVIGALGIAVGFPIMKLLIHILNCLLRQVELDKAFAQSILDLRIILYNKLNLGSPANDDAGWFSSLKRVVGI